LGYNGGFGDVFVGRFLTIRNSLPESIAVRRYDNVGKSVLTEFRKEAGVHSVLHHDNLPVIHGAICDVDMTALVVENTEAWPSLYHRLHETHDEMTWFQCLRIMEEVVSGVAYLHALDIVHGDIKVFATNAFSMPNFQFLIVFFHAHRHRIFDLAWTIVPSWSVWSSNRWFLRTTSPPLLPPL
jgi:serine/threonine protein kinase